MPYDPKTIPLYSIGPMALKCKFCGAKFWAAERTSASNNSYAPDKVRFGQKCCADGQIQLDAFPSPPEPLYSLYNGTHPMSRHFKFDISKPWKLKTPLNMFRQLAILYNNRFALSSVGARINEGLTGHGPPCYRLQGGMAHRFAKFFSPI